jgi:hypothetical protein
MTNLGQFDGGNLVFYIMGKAYRCIWAKLLENHSLEDYSSVTTRLTLQDSYQPGIIVIFRYALSGLPLPFVVPFNCHTAVIMQEMMTLTRNRSAIVLSNKSNTFIYMKTPLKGHCSCMANRQPSYRH